MSAISQKSITGITSITTPAGVDNQLTLHNNNTTEAVKLDVAGNLHFHNHLNITGVTTVAGSIVQTSGHTQLRSFSNPTSGAGMELGYDGTRAIIQPYDRDNSVSKNLYIAANVGINQLNPTAKLDVAGDVKVSGTLDANGDLDVDGHTNLDNVSIAGVSTFSDDVKLTVANGIGILLDKSTSQFNINSGTTVRFQNNNEVNTDDGKIGTALFASGLNIVGSQTGSGLGRQIRLYGDLLTNAIKPTADSSYSIGTSSNRFLHAYIDNIDVDGHTNLDNVSIAGVTTVSNKTQVNSLGIGIQPIDHHHIHIESANPRVLIRSTGTNSAKIFFGDNSSNDPGVIEYEHTNNRMRFGTNNTEDRLVIDSNGNIGINDTAPPNFTGYKSLSIHGSTGGALVFGDDGTDEWETYGGDGVFKIYDRAATTTRLHLDGSYGRFGINTSSFSDTSTALSLKNGVAGNDHTILDIICNDNQTCRLTFSEDSNSSKGSIRYYYTGDANYMSFYTNGGASSNERLRINSNGSLNIGGTYTGTTHKLQVDNGTTHFKGRVFIRGTMSFNSTPFGANVTYDTGISVNAGGYGGSILAICSKNYGAGTNTQSGVYLIKFHYDGNNTPSITLIAGSNLATFGQSGSNTLTVAMGASNNMFTAIESSVVPTT